MFDFNNQRCYNLLVNKYQTGGEIKMKDFKDIILDGVIIGMAILFAGGAFILILSMVPYLYILLTLIIKNISTILTVLAIVATPIVVGIVISTVWWLIGNKRK